MNIGSSNRLIYDECDYRTSIAESTAPITYQLYFNKHEHCNRCVDQKLYPKFDTQIVDVESELLNINRPNSRCPSKKYNPNCKASKSCYSTFEPDAPVILAPELCPIIYNNIPKVTDPKTRLPGKDLCGELSSIPERYNDMKLKH